MIIVEGPDNAGKSTLVKELLEMDPSLRYLEREPYRVRHGKKIDGQVFLNPLLPTDGDRLHHANSVADRSFISECIYGELFRGGCSLSDGEHFALRNVLQSYAALVVHCDPGDAQIKKGWKAREQLYDKDPLVIAQAYRLRLEGLIPGLRVVPYNWVRSDLQYVVQLHRQILKYHQEALSWWSAIPFGAGELRSPSIVLVGEGLSPLATTTVPFAHGPAGEFLAWTIKQVEDRMDEELQPQMYLTNADKGVEHNAALLREELRLLQLKAGSIIIALGREAQSLVEYAAPDGVKQAHVPHPQFWRRFHYPQRDQYVDMFHNLLKRST